MTYKKNLIVIVGPTAIGKTALAISIAKKFNTEILSADSRQFFKEMNIGTAKPSLLELKQVKHHFIDSHSISDSFNVGKFEQEAISLLNTLFIKHDVVVLVGGSGLYIDAVCKGFDELPEADSEVRQKIASILSEQGVAGLQVLLKDIDPEYYSKVDINNPQRLSRALEVCLSTGKKYSDLRKGKTKTRNFNSIKIGLNTSRELLYERINKRVDEMITNGLYEEVKKLLPYKRLNALQTVGYKEFFDYIEHNSDLKETVDAIKQNTRNFAKRQITWFKRDTETTWFEPNELNEIVLFINEKIK